MTFKKGDIIQYGIRGEIALVDEIADPGIYWVIKGKMTHRNFFNAYDLFYSELMNLTLICEL